ncbi:MAG: hemerythrin family protein [Candidatus Adiutrix sp.]|jgi:hemerythrin|nr:hemerythrin family protein [Candidatus Adiutrix sp.]
MLWSASLETGIPKIDEQHKELFRQIDILMDRSQAARIPATLEFLGKYVVKHFGDEQVLHATSKYPKAMAHKQMHIAFIAKYKEMKSEYETAGDKLTVVLNINKICVGWLKDHILVHDKEFATYYKAINN